MLDLLYCTPTVLTFSILLPLCPPPRCALVQATCARTPIAPSALSFRAGAIAPVNAPFSTAARSGPVLPPSARVRCSLEGGRWVAWHHPCSCTHSHTASHTASLTHFHLPSLSMCPLLLLPVAEPPSPTHALTHALTHTHSHTRTHTRTAIPTTVSPTTPNPCRGLRRSRNSDSCAERCGALGKDTSFFYEYEGCTHVRACGDCYCTPFAHKHAHNLLLCGSCVPMACAVLLHL